VITGISLLLAGLLAFLLRGTILENYLPFLFLGLVVAIAAIFGSTVGIPATMGAGVIFAAFLFDPVVSVRIGDVAQRSNLIWMTIGGISASELLGAKKTSARR
jgi:K+-sensing histidine kinase KdpD